ncbi:GNAT family N-acetyltransferase [Jeotgalibacillus soli]|uniref:N-acetyltransferase domain-containing protein n=1 Tax=Jeotgalibacillus soli TaxID=889306 RepID=A0A0C2RTH9_9BACL|nr:GNAT family N-acetyltransferase [Jeotgalibacillus soli]KIL45024.1 hypothetical protein KP78_25680 [Jeotgalibacillus soli]
MLTFREITEDKAYWHPYLYLADDAHEDVRQYAEQGFLFVFEDSGEPVGVMLLIPQNAAVLEIKNIGLLDKARGKGFGRQMIEVAIETAKDRGYRTLEVGTANSSIDNLIFYQKVGFRMAAVKQNYFVKYDPPVYENGIYGKDMIVFRMELVSSEKE